MYRYSNETVKQLWKLYLYKGGGVLFLLDYNLHCVLYDDLDWITLSCARILLSMVTIFEPSADNTWFPVSFAITSRKIVTK